MNKEVWDILMEHKAVLSWQERLKKNLYKDIADLLSSKYASLRTFDQIHALREYADTLENVDSK